MDQKKEISGIILFSIALFLLVIKLWIPNFFLLTWKPSLVRGLPSTIAVAEEEFDLRVKRKFLPNTSSSEIEKELSRQGFEIKNIREKKLASFELSNIACRLQYRITWKVNDRDEIYNLRGDYGAVCL